MAIISIIGVDYSSVSVVNFPMDMWYRMWILKTLIITALRYVLWDRFTVYHFSEEIAFVCYVWKSEIPDIVMYHIS
jgi:hypothetical protein